MKGILGALPVLALIAAPGAGTAQAGEYVSPVALAADAARGRLYVADHTGSRIVVFEVAGGRTGSVIPLPDRPNGLALSADGARLYVGAGGAAGKVHVVDTGSGRVTRSIAAGHTPTAAALGRGGTRLYVCNRYTNDVSAIDLPSMTETARIAVAREPVAAVLSADGRRLFVGNQLPRGPSNSGDVAAEISVIDTATHRAGPAIRLPDGGTGVRGMCLSPDGRHLYVTHLLARYQLPASQIERGWIQTNAFTVIDAGRALPVNTVLLDDITLGAANPWAVACTPDGRRLVIAHAGTHELSVIDRAALHGKLDQAARGGRVTDVSASAPDVKNDMAFLTGMRTRVPLAGNGPRALAAMGSVLYAAEYFSGSLGAVDLAAEGTPEARSVTLGDQPPQAAERRGEMLFHDGQHCYQKWLSCASCHPNEARPDGLNWDLLLDGVGNPKNTKSLLAAHRTPATTWTATRPHAVASVRAGYLNIQFAGRPEEDAAAVDAYLKSLRPVPSPHLEKGGWSAAAARGSKVFASAGCAACHSGEWYTGLGKYNVGTGRGREKETEFDTPALVEVWRTAPYFHDGRAATLQDVFRLPDAGGVHDLRRKLPKQQVDDLVAFLMSL